MGEVGAILLALVVLLVIGNLWFHFVESVLGKVKSLFTRGKEPPAWHPLPPEEEENGNA